MVRIKMKKPFYRRKIVYKYIGGDKKAKKENYNQTTYK